MTARDARRAVPAVDSVVARLAGDRPDGGAALPHPLLVECARRAVDHARARAADGVHPDEDEVVAEASLHAAALGRSLLRRVVNATGVLVHTNLGRAPLPTPSLDAAGDAATGYSNLEYRLDEGVRGSRHEHAASLLARYVGAEAGIAVNNNAAAVLLVLAALARGGEVVVSRGELVEIGGGFRIPEIMAESGARLVEVGTTNRTRRADYEGALGPDTAAVLKVHASNYRMVGFVEETPVSALVDLGPPVVFDAGSGLLDAATPWLPERPAWLGDEPGIRQAVDAGAGVVTFSGDKLLGGPQAGVIVGRADLVARVSRHPLARAVRADKLTLAALQSVALTYLAGDAASLPLWRMATAPVEALRSRAERLAAGLGAAEVVDTRSALGGGSLPGTSVESAGVALRPSSGSADGLAAALRLEGVVGRVRDDVLVLDLRAVEPSDDAAVRDAVERALGVS